MWCLRGELGWGWEPRAHWRTMAGESGTVAILRRLLANLELRDELGRAQSATGWERPWAGTVAVSTGSSQGWGVSSGTWPSFGEECPWISPSPFQTIPCGVSLTLSPLFDSFSRACLAGHGRTCAVNLALGDPTRLVLLTGAIRLWPDRGTGLVRWSKIKSSGPTQAGTTAVASVI